MIASERTDTERRAFRLQACADMGLPRTRQYAVCPVHGGRGRVEDIYALNNWCIEDGTGLRCEPSHPFCFDWCSLPDADKDAARGIRESTP